LLLTAATACVGLSGCASPGEERREYSLPSDFCNLPLDAGLYEGLLPPGEQLDITGGIDGAYASSDCRLEVDGEPFAYVEASPNGGVDTMAAQYGEAAEGPRETVPGEYEAAVWERLGIVSARCRPRDALYFWDYSLTIVVREADDDTQEILSNLLQPAMTAALEHIGCEETASPDDPEASPPIPEG
jgi:hypothetical protein